MCTPDVSQRPAQFFHLLITQPSTTPVGDFEVTLQPQLVYKEASWTQIIQYRLCSCFDNISSTSLHLTTACCSWMFHAQRRRLILEVPHACLPKDHKLLLCKSTCPAPNVPAKRPQVATSQDHPVPVIITTSSCPCGAACCSCEPELPSGPQFPLGIGCPRGMVLVPLCGTSPCSCELALASLCHFNK